MATPTPEVVSMESLLGAKLLMKANGDSKSTKTLMKNKDLVALYFSASWCPPCKVFSPLLREFYHAAAKENKLEIVYVSSDRDAASFGEYYKKMPWMAIPFEDNSVRGSLGQTCGIQGIPTLVILDAKTGEFITANARGHVEDAGGDPTKAKETIETWKKMERKPLSEASNNMPSEAINPVMRIIKFFVSNPVYIFALMYFVRYVRKQMKEWYPETALIVEDEVPEAAADGSEF